ncbi:class I SAM-dependent methyltransferase [Embleya scabrispora]|uniref:class I SAM-dependent methyltransferase n=1 Tax=Embleya scabrispora TaxID=159449 RepID=UPI00036AEBB2|nr:class I SAM-dependent methyltransferase [Embleya scabrispora]MYS87574.1 methyltransferase domain-containing protein [Streptomyces sp. SID5474]
MIEPDFLQATRTSYDAVATEYTEYARTDLANKPLDRAQLAAFAEFVGSAHAGTGSVADVGCGTGRITAHLRELGLDVFGIDLSPGMIAVARREHPDLRFEVGSMTDLDLPDGSLAGLVAWYSIIHVPVEQLPGVFAEFHRVLAPGGRLLLAFQVGDEPLRLTEAFGRAVSLDFHRRRPERIAGLVTDAGLTMHAQMIREPDPGEGVRPTQHAYLSARKPLPAQDD